jgi:hypothetical protein
MGKDNDLLKGHKLIRTNYLFGIIAGMYRWRIGGRVSVI